MDSAIIKEILTREPHRIGNKLIKLKHGKPTKWGWVVWHPENLVLGENVDIGWATALFAHHDVQIGNNVQIGAFCALYSLNTEDGTAGKITIDDGVNIGAHCVILPGVKIGVGARVGAFSLVKADIPANALAYGVPARVVG